MTVYTVSQAYLDGMDAAFRLPVLLEGEILNIDAETQAAVSLSASGMLGGCTLADVSEVSAAPFQDTATLEPDRMTASGAYRIITLFSAVVSPGFPQRLRTGGENTPYPALRSRWSLARTGTTIPARGS